LQRDRKDVEGALSRKGFEEISGKGRGQDHRYFTFKSSNGQKVATTHTSHGSSYKSLGDSLLSAMARQCHLTKSEFVSLVDCTLTQQDYEDKLIEKDLLVYETNLEEQNKQTEDIENDD
jgi:hypothetical protein